MDRVAKIIVDAALAEMSRISGASVGEILSVIVSDPTGATARRFAEYVALGVKAAA